MDNGAQISLIKEKRIPQTLKINTSLTYVSGVKETHKAIKTLGFVNIPIKLGDKIMETKFHVINDELSIEQDGLIGGKFCRASKAVIDYKRERIVIEQYNATIPFYNLHIIPPRTMRIMTIRTNMPDSDFLVLSSSLSKELLAPDAAVRVRKETFNISLTNLSEKPFDTSDLQVKLKPFEPVKIKLTKIMPPKEKKTTKQFSVKENNEFLYERIAELTRLEHLYLTKRRQIMQVIWDFNDLIALKGEEINHTVAKLECEIPTKPRHPQAAIFYRIPNKHRPIVEAYTKDLLDQGILKHSTSPWNAPCLVVPKKLDASGERKWRVVIDY